jgi:hypothetical protein
MKTTFEMKTQDDRNGETRGSRPPAGSKPQHPDVTGLYFMSYESGRTGWRGRVQEAVNGLLLIQLYDWVDHHRPLERLLVPIAQTLWNDMPGTLQSGWKFYPDEQSWMEAYADEKESDGEEQES